MDKNRTPRERDKRIESLPPRDGKSAASGSDEWTAADQAAWERMNMRDKAS